MRRSRTAQYEGTTEKVLLDCLLQRMVAETPQAGTLVIRAEENLSRVRTGVCVWQRKIPPQNLLQPRLCEQGQSHRKDYAQ